MYQNNYNGFQQIPVRTTPIGLKGRPVSSLEEARAATIDFDGSIFFFPDLASNRIYTKQINVDGTASLKMYEYKEIPTVENNNEFITRQEFDQTLTEIKNNLATLSLKEKEKKDTAAMVAKQF